MRPGRHTIARQRRLVATFLTIAVITATTAGAATYPLKKSANQRYLVDQDNVPYLMIGDSPQALIVNISESEAEMFFANRSAQVQSVMQTPVGGAADVPTGMDGPPVGLTLSTDTPNSLRSTMRISFGLKGAGESDLEIFDASGRLVRTLERGSFPAGRHSTEWNGTNDAGRAVPSGRYFLRLRSGGAERTISLVLLR